ncbi:MAG: GGDEF domain-containing protein [Acidobacteriota bacterium]|nr:GGDEF domain-containing protein [Acidobacteriota bacterium]
MNRSAEEYDQGADTQRIRQILAEMKALEGRDLQLWSIGLLLLVVLGAGIAAVTLPIGRVVELESRSALILAYGLVSLIVLYNVYALVQKRGLRLARADLVRQLMRAEAAEQLAMSDPLTGLFNRRYLEHALTTEAKRVSRTGQTLSILMLDLDHFGDINKRLGHLEGDRILCEFAHLMTTVFRQTDIVTRFGGDEFVVLLADASSEQAALAKNRLLSAIELRNRGETDPTRHLLVSAGIAEHREDADVSETLQRADEALRRTKAERRADGSR